MAYETVDMPMEEPGPQACLRCGRALAVRRDRETGKPIASDGRAMLQCPGCGSIEIGKDPVAWGRRFRIVRWLMVGSTGAFFAAETCREILRVAEMARGGLPESHWRWMAYLVMGFAAAGSAHMGCFYLAHGLSPTQPMKDRIDSWALAVLGFVCLAFFVWAALGMTWPFLLPRP